MNHVMIRWNSKNFWEQKNSVILPETNIAPENPWLEDDFCRIAYFQQL